LEVKTGRLLVGGVLFRVIEGAIEEMISLHADGEKDEERG